jgi:endonuclease YncB( thermonuclease family)
MQRASFILAVLASCAIAQAAEISGVPRVVDGDTLAIGAMKVRLEGIDAPETDQICLAATGVHWTCGIEARDRLKAHIEDQAVVCLSNSTDVYQRSLATCSLKGDNLNAWMVQEGWALAYLKYSSVYQQVEEDARVHQRGLWQGAFIAPWDWRHKNNKTIILGALQVPINAQALLLGPSATEGAPSPDCTIKGNINRNGERIYHLQNQQFYARIKMDKGDGRRWFCTPQEAEAAGWRRALR